MSDEIILTVEGCSISYGGVVAVDDVSVELKRGQIVTILGSNGAGKTTLLSGIMGLCPISRGVIRYRGRTNPWARVEDRIADRVILVPESRELFRTMSVADNLLLGHYSLRKNRSSLQRGLETVFQMFPRLKERREQLAETLSGGERQMLALGRAMMAQPDVLLLDEPSLGLAPIIIREIFAAIQQLSKTTSVSIVLVEQNARTALSIADYAYVLEAGRLKMQGVASALASDSTIQNAYLGGAGR